MSIAFSFGGTPATLNFIFYIVNSGKLFAMETDPVATSTPLLNGVILQQNIPPGGFSASSLHGGAVISLSGAAVCGDGGTNSAADVLAGLLTADGNGGLSLSYDENCGGTASSGAGLPGTYGVASNGRASIGVCN